MNPFDLVLLVLMGILALMGALWGITRMAAAFLGFLVAFFLGLKAASYGPVWFGGWIERPEWARLTAFLLVFFGVMVAAALLAFLLRRLLRAILLGWADRLAGALVGVVIALLVGAALAVPLTALPPTDEPILDDSVLAPYALGAADFIRHLIPADLAEQYHQKSRALRDAWRESTRDEEDDGSHR